MVSYTLFLMSKINTVIRIHKGLWFAGGKRWEENHRKSTSYMYNKI